MGETNRQSLGKTLGQLWGLIFIAALFGMGGFRLTDKAVGFTHDAGLTNPSSQMQPQGVIDYALYALLLIAGAGKAEMLFRRKFIPRTLARARDALGETAWAGDYLLAPFCMLSLYRPWQTKHLILSWVLIPAMVTLTVLFIVVVPDGPFKGAVDLGIGLALLYGAAVYVFYLLRFMGWWLGQGANPETCPFPRRDEVR
ncbi:MAG: hypothetical protein L0099_07965 [Acidobacteria bacterium]|nr:hypothetical protein [Acidobacteriota bacterium]